MRIVKITVQGKEYELTFSNRVMMRLEQEKLDMESLTGMLTMLSAMMEAGDRLAKREGRPAPGFMTVDDLADTMGPEEIHALIGAMNEAQTGERNVETLDDPKNAESTPSAP